MKPFDLEAAQRGEPVVTQIGEEFLFGGYNPDASAQILGWVKRNNEWTWSAWKKDGQHVYGGQFDLVMAPKKKMIWCRAWLDGGDVRVATSEDKNELFHDWIFHNWTSSKWLDPEPWSHEVEL